MFFVGLDLGQRKDFTAVAVVEREERNWVEGPRLMVRHLERMALGTAYTRVVERVFRMMRHPALERDARLVVDATGVGAPVVELLRSAGLAGRITAVTITGGEQAHGASEEWRVPRRDLLMGLEVLLEAGELTIARRLAEAERLKRELTRIQVGGRRSDGGEHDDLVIALGLACWRARAGRRRGFGTQRLPGI
jgi:hypothetical protein